VGGDAAVKLLIEAGRVDVHDNIHAQTC
jgi:hypothetical protein